MKTATKTLSSTPTKIAETQLKIIAITAEVEKQNKHVNEFEEAVNLIETEPK